jgi:molecular chaperone GrpE (heat shock protein)
MNKLLLKGKEVMDSYFECDDVLQVVTQIKDQMEREKKVVCSIKLNDKEIPEDQEPSLVQFKLSNVRILEVEYCEYDEFYAEFIDSTTKFVTDLKQICPYLSESIYDQKTERFQHLFQDFIESLDSLMTALHFIHYKGDQRANETQWSEVEKRTSAVLQQVLQLYPAKDFVSLADVFDYEMIDVLEDWLRLLQTMKADEQLRTRQSQNN